jgi:hypothetical protein
VGKQIPNGTPPFLGFPVPGNRTPFRPRAQQEALYAGLSPLARAILPDGPSRGMTLMVTVSDFIRRQRLGDPLDPAARQEVLEAFEELLSKDIWRRDTRYTMARYWVWMP